jgi:hypothetical protein
VEEEWEMFREKEGLSQLSKEEMADFLLSFQDDLLNPGKYSLFVNINLLEILTLR